MAEPATAITDFILAASSWWFARRLRDGTSSAARRWWSRAFVFIGAGALAGGVWHGFHQVMPPVVDSSLWRLCLLLTLASSLCLWQAAATGFPLASHPESWRRLGWLKAAACAVLALLRPEFLVVLTDFAASMLFLAVRTLLNRHRPEAPAFLTALALFAAGAAIQSQGWAPHAGFNHNDLFHVIQLAANCVFFVGARKT